MGSLERYVAEAFCVGKNIRVAQDFLGKLNPYFSLDKDEMGIRIDGIEIENEILELGDPSVVRLVFAYLLVYFYTNSKSPDCLKIKLKIQPYLELGRIVNLQFDADVHETMTKLADLYRRQTEVGKQTDFFKGLKKLLKGYSGQDYMPEEEDLSNSPTEEEGKDREIGRTILSKIHRRVDKPIELYENMDETTKMILSAEELELVQKSTFSLSSFEVKRSTNTIVSRFEYFFGICGAQDALNQAYLYSDDFRRAIVTSGCIFWERDHDTLDRHTIEEIEENLRHQMEEREGADHGSRFSALCSFLSFILNGNAFREMKYGYGALNLDRFHFWPGMGTVIPKGVKTNLKFGQLYPDVIVFDKEKGFDQQLAFQEGAWDATLVASKGFAKVDPGNGVNYHLGSITSSEPIGRDRTVKMDGTNIQEEAYAFMGINSSPVSQGDSQMVRISLAKDRSNYPHTKFSINNDFDECEIIITLPYIPPLQDSLCSIKIPTGRAGSGEEHIVLTTC